MSKKTPLTPQSRRLNRINARATMAPGDISIAVSSVSANRRLPFTRQSVMPNMTMIDNEKKVDYGSKDSELKYLYNRHLETDITKFLVNEKSGKTEKVALIQLASLMSEENCVKNESSVTRLRERELKRLTDLQNSLDDQRMEIKGCLGDFAGMSKEILKKLQLMLKSLDVLKCNNLIIPENEEDMEKMRNELEKCSSLLHSINETIGTKRDALVTAGKGFKTFNKTYSEIQDCSMRCQKALEQLQIRSLKEAASALALVRRDESLTMIE